MPAIESAAPITRFGKTKPDFAVQSTHQIVRVAGQVVEEDSGLGPASCNVEVVSRHRDLPHSVFTGLVDEQVLLVVT
ncbi:hypothetical protein [Nitrosospira sp. Is2]|uniref:hypothetical protein n=1 Tax=Nitrosospira sp. Is2 TaxID=3080532 RepID=UPI0029548DFD|nr:hypothetical protein [Nitrosospira sp. Is2]WON73563.1 hypothetical protein R5L00_13950 [Nitrosospira sp. Is2]